MMLADDVVDQELGGIRQNHAAQPVDNHQTKPDGQQVTPRQDHFAQIGPDIAEALGRATLRRLGAVAPLALAAGSFNGGMRAHYF